MGGGKTLAFEIVENIKSYAPININPLRKLRIILDIIDCYIVYGSTPQEYFLMGFMENKKTRSKFLTNQYKDRQMIKSVGMGDNWYLLEDKWNFYLRFKSFIKRDVCLLNSETSKNVFKNFYEGKKKIIVKPLNGQCGKGIFVINTNDKSCDEIYYKFIKDKNDYIAEEFIVQDSFMNQWNDTSVNTVRLPCFYNEKGFFVLKPFLRTGRKGSVVDNGNAGGIFAVIDDKTGIIVTEGMDIKGQRYSKHPDSEITFYGTQIPKWNELLSIAKEIHKTIPFYPYVGWDFALTSKGWVLIEGNWGQFLSEFVDREGIKEKFDVLLGK